jgi:hypothetical protein
LPFSLPLAGLKSNLPRKQESPSERKPPWMVQRPESMSAQASDCPDCQFLAVRASELLHCSKNLGLNFQALDFRPPVALELCQRFID